jgi:TolB-like protein
MSITNKRKIAVVEFTDLDGKITELGKYLSEELITSLFKTKKFEVVERQLLNKVIEEHKLNMVGLIDPKTAKEIGRILGVDALCSGTIADLVNSIKVNARLISTETGAIFAVASANIHKDEVVRKLMGKVSHISTSTPTGAVTKTVDGKVVFYEDFSRVAEGMIPKDWSGGETLIVKNSSKRFGKKVLQNFRKGKHHFTIPNLSIPDNFKFEMEMTNYDSCCDAIIISIGSLGFGLHTNGASWLGDSKFYINPRKRTDSGYIPWDRGEVFTITLEKLGPVFRLMMNGRQLVMIREVNFKKASSITFRYGGAFGIYTIVLKEMT